MSFFPIYQNNFADFSLNGTQPPKNRRTTMRAGKGHYALAVCVVCAAMVLFLHAVAFAAASLLYMALH